MSNPCDFYIHGKKMKMDEFLSYIKGMPHKELNDVLGGIPSFKNIPEAPFITETASWVRLGMKTALKEAVKQNASVIAWTTGEQQNDRYDLSKQVDELFYQKLSNGKYQVDADKDGKTVFTREFTEQELPNFVGKEVAEKIVKNEGKLLYNAPTYLGESVPKYSLKEKDLQIGGKGMKGFYGSPSEGKLGIVGEVAKSLFKQEPGTINIGAGEKLEIRPAKDGEGYFVYSESGESMSGRFDTKLEAQDFINRNKKGGNVNEFTQHFIEITPELRQEAESGLPLFKDIKGRGKEIADLLRKGKIKMGGLQSNIAGIPIAIYNAAIETIALALEGGATLTQAIQKAINKHKLNQQKGFNQKEFISKLEDATGEKFTDDQQQPPPPQTPKQEPKEVGGEEEKPSGIKKALVSQKTLQEVNLEKVSDKEMMSLGREIINSGEVKPRELVEKIISEKTGVLTPTEVVALITYKADLDNKEREIYEEINKKKEAGEDLGTLQVEAKEIERQIQDYEVMAVITAASQSMAFRLRQKILDRDYNVITQIEKYKSKNNGVIPQDIENKFRELGKQIDELKKKLFEAESKVEKEAEIDAVNNIKESVDMETAYTEEELNKKIQEGVENEISKIYESLPEEKKSAADKAISALEKFRAKIKSRTYESTLGLPLAIADLGALTAIRAIKVGKTVAEAVEIGIKRIKQALKDKGINKWDEENDYRNELTKTLEEEGVSLKKVKDKPIYNEDGSVSIPHKMIRDLVSKGFTDIESLTDEVYKEVVKELPEITKREVRDYITKYGKEVNPTKDEIEIKINQAKRIGRLLSELEDLQKRKVRSKNGLPLRLTEREKGLKRQIRTLAKDLVPKEELSDVEKISAAKERVKNRISELNRRIRNKDFAKPKKVIKPTDEELNKLMAEKERLQEEFETEQYRLEIKNRGFWKKAEDWLMELTNGLVRGLVASFDLSAGFVQGVWRLFTNPIKSLNAFGQMFKHLVSEKNAQEYLDKIKASPYYPLIKASKLAIDDKSGKVSVKEGFFISNWVNLIWDKVISSILGFGTKRGINFFRKINPYAASQRAFDGYVNSIRVQSFIELAKALEKEGMTYESNPKDFEKAADFVNTTTGRGGLGQADSSSRWLNIFLFAPRKVISEVKLFTPYAFAYYARMPKSVRKKALANFIKFTSLYFTTNALLWAARKDWDEDDEDDNFWNPNSSDFLTHKINNKRISIGGGMKSILTFQSRLFSGKYTDQYGQTSNLGERYGKTVNTRLDLVWRYILGKASPAVSVAAKKLDEKKGVEVDDSEIIKNLTIPIWLQDLKELYKDNPTEVNAFLTMMAILGANTRTVKKDYKIPTKIEIEGAKVELNSEQQEFLETEIERRRDMYMEKAKSKRDYDNLSDKRKFEISDEINKKAVKEAEQLLVKDRRYKTFFKQKAKQIKEEEKSKKELKEQEKDFINKIIK